jgi:hypothetical protein
MCLGLHRVIFQINETNPRKNAGWKKKYPSQKKSTSILGTDHL